MEYINIEIESAKKAAKAALEAKIKQIRREDELRNMAPDYALPKRVSYAAYNKVDTITYEAESAEQAALIIRSYRNKYGAFLRIGKYVRSCCVITAYPWKEYMEPAALMDVEFDAVVARNRKGSGFSSVSFVFYPNIEGQRVAVQIDLAFRKYIQGFEGNIVKVRGHGPAYYSKEAPAAYKSATYCVNFSGSSKDAADWQAVYQCEELLNRFE